MSIRDFGFDEYFERECVKAGVEPASVGRVVAEHREAYRVMTDAGERSAKVTGKRMFTAASREEYPAVGDWVVVSELNAEQAVIQSILPRRTVLKRKEAGGEGMQLIAANVDTAFIVQAVGRDFNINRFERYASLVTTGGVEPVVVLNKSDMASKEELDALVLQVKERLPGVEVMVTNTRRDEGSHALKGRIVKGQTYCFLGSSGVGKSSLINALIGASLRATGTVSARTEKGQHITTARALFMLPGGAMVIDTPGMRELGVVDAQQGIGDIFDRITELAASCRFPDCSHTNEPGCAVRAALAAGEINAQQLESYMKLKKENDFSELSALERRGKDRAFGKFLKKAKGEINRD